MVKVCKSGPTVRSTKVNGNVIKLMAKEGLSKAKVMSTSVIGRTIWLTVKESIRVMMAPFITETGSTTSSTVLVMRYGQTVAGTRAIML